MKNLKIIIVGTSLAIIGLSACNQSQNNSLRDSNVTSSEKLTVQDPLNAEETKFVENYIQMGLAHTELSKQIEESTSSQRVKSFANMVISDQKAAYQELALLIQNVNADILDSLLNINRPDSNFAAKENSDKAYMDTMEVEYKTAINNLKEISPKAENPQLKTWLVNTLPRLQQNLDSIMAINRQLY